MLNLSPISSKRKSCTICISWTRRQFIAVNDCPNCLVERHKAVLLHVGLQLIELVIICCPPVGIGSKDGIECRQKCPRMVRRIVIHLLFSLHTIFAEHEILHIAHLRLYVPFGTLPHIALRHIVWHVIMPSMYFF